jgi:hypothetical protein
MTEPEGAKQSKEGSRPIALRSNVSRRAEVPLRMLGSVPMRGQSPRVWADVKSTPEGFERLV